MRTYINRRDFLKLAGLLSMSYAAAGKLPRASGQAEPPQNVLVIVFDTFSASNMSLYGYPRRTTPNISRLAEKATVYHNHYAGGNFTTPGTSTLMTGALPWSTRAFGVNDRVSDAYAHKSIFHAFAGHTRYAYSHNLLANTLLNQFFTGMEGLQPRVSLYLNNDVLINTFFKNDLDIASVSWVRGMKRQNFGYSYSLFLSQIYEKLTNRVVADWREQFPLGLPAMVDDNYFVLEDGIDWVLDLLPGAQQPYLGYFHFNPPHDPYHTRREFFDTFANDGFFPPDKPRHPLHDDRSKERLLQWRKEYDEFILYVDSEFDRLYRSLEASGLLENTWLILTSDHGEMFERGFLGHRLDVLYQPVIHIPLLIFAPGQTNREDIYETTSALDVLPTLRHLTGHPIPEWSEGQVLPPYGVEPADPDRHVYALQVSGIDPDGAITNASVALMRGQYKLHYLFGYEGLGASGESQELFDVQNDPEELTNLSESERATAEEMLADIKARLRQVNGQA